VGNSVLQNNYSGHGTPAKQTFRHTGKCTVGLILPSLGTVGLTYALCLK